VTRFFAQPGARSAAVARIAMALSLLLILRRHLETPVFAASQPAALFRPIGVVKLLGHGVVSRPVLYGLLFVAAATAVLLLVGLFSRAAMWIAFTAALTLVSVSYSFTLPWSHGECVTFLAGLPLLFARLGDAWSLDARRRATAPARGLAYGVPLRGAQAMLAVYFLNAFYWKMTTSGIDWALSDNLRNIFALRFLVIGQQPPWIVSAALTRPSLTHLMALGNLAAQATPALMLPLLRWRPCQVIAAGAWFAETIGLSTVMMLFGWEMVPLGLLFLDFDRGQAEIRAPARWFPALAASIAVLVSAQIATAWSKADLHQLMYPLTSTSMYSQLHGPIEERLTITTRPALPTAFERRVRLIYTGALSAGARCVALRRASSINAEYTARYGHPLRSIAVRLDTWDVTEDTARVVSSKPIATWRAGVACQG
jgi:hypothetical protein